MQVYKINNFLGYELHYSTDEQLIYSLKSEKYLKLSKDGDGYLRVNLYKNGKQRTFRIHQIVWMCLKGEIPKGLEINHIDEDKLNNSIENLELVSHLENMRHGTLGKRISKANIGKFINRQDQSKPIVGIKKDLSEILNYPSTREAERDKDRGFHQQNISYCCLNKYKTSKGYYWFFKDDFEEYLTRFNNNLKEVIKYKLSL